MTEVLISNLAKEGEKRPFKAHGHVLVGSAGGACYTHATFEPGWRWSQDVAPLAGTKSCQTRHLGYVVSGEMHIIVDDGTEIDVRPGDAFDLPAGHDAFVVGDEPCIMIDISPQATTYARAGVTAAAGDRYTEIVRRGYQAFNTGDVETLRGLLSIDVIQHVPGASQLTGDYKGIDAVLEYYGRIGELTDGTARAHLVDVHSDGHGHAVSSHVLSATRKGTTLVTRGSILFTFIGEKATDLLELHADTPAFDAFFA